MLETTGDNTRETTLKSVMGLSDGTESEYQTKTNAPVVLLTGEERAALLFEKNGTYEISENQALDMLENFAHNVASDFSKIRSNNAVLKKSRNSGKNMYYEIVFEGKKGPGFALVSADERVPEVLCFIENGSISDTVFNENMRYCMQLLDLYVEDKIEKNLDVEALASSVKDRLGLDREKEVQTRGGGKIIPPDCGFVTLSRFTEETVYTRLKQIPYQAESWHQYYPYNALLPGGIGCSNVPAGCGIIATALIMSYGQKNFSNYIVKSTWTSMLDNTNSTELKTLIKDIYNAIQTASDCSGTASNFSKAKTFLSNNGYTVGNIVSFGSTSVWDALNWGPTMIRGDGLDNSGSKIGHAWVIDGVNNITTHHYEKWTYTKCTIEEIYYMGSTPSQSLRFVWGWGNSYQNVWYKSGIFKPEYSSYNFSLNVQLFDKIL